MIDFVQLDLITFHDLPVEQITISFDEGIKFKIVFREYDKNKDEYNNVLITFDKITNLDVSDYKLDNDSSVDISSFDYYMKGKCLHGKLILNLGFGKSIAIYDVVCEEVRVN